MKIEVETSSANYPVVVSSLAVQQLKEYLPNDYDSLYVLADASVWNLHSEYFSHHIGVDFQLYELPSGEACKTFSVYEQIMTFLLEQGATRKSIIVAFGGGATGDVSGYVAATFMRGISFIQLPTTILAHDSAVGGKTGINHPLGKNMVGAFHQPLAVLYDENFLSTLPFSEIRSGFSELVKHALLSNADWTQELMSLTTEKQLLLLPWSEQLAKGIQVKAAIVKLDEFEVHERKFLNLGHTYGHAVEALSGFGRIKHGEAVALGLVIDLIVSGQRKLAKQWFNQMIQLEYPYTFVTQLSFSDLMIYMKKDKKNQANQLHFITLPEVGKPQIEVVSEQQVEQAHIVMCEWIEEVR